MTTDGDDVALLARKAHRTLEPVHVIGYFAPEPTARVAALGIDGGMRAYFAARSAPMGRVAAEVVVATFFNFKPANIGKAIPSVWDVTTPETVIEAWHDGVDEAYRRVLGDDVIGSKEMAEAAELAREATTVLASQGRPLFAAWHALPWPEPAHLQLFRAQTLLREHRGDGHVAALVVAGLDGLEALVSYDPLGEGMPKELVLATRGWSIDEWDAAVERLHRRGLLEQDGSYTPAGKAQRDTVEAQTDAAAVAPYRHLGPERTTRLRELVRPWSRTFAKELFGGNQ